MNSILVDPQQKRTTKFHYLVLIGLVILASIERVYGIDRQGLWSDELFAVIVSYKHNLQFIWHDLVNDSHPPGYVLLMYITLPLTGYSDFGIRLHALIYGIVWIPLIYWLGKRWFSAHVGLLAAALITSSYSAIYFSQEARAYSMLVAFSLGNLICYFEMLFARKLKRGYVSGFIISSILILYLHYTCFVFFAAEGLFYLILWLAQYRKGSVMELARYFGIPLLAYAPWMGVMINHLADDSRGWVLSVVPTMQVVYYTFQNLWGPEYRLLNAYLYALGLALLIAVYRHYKNRNHRQSVIVYTLLFLLVVPVLAFYIESITWTPIFEKRYFLITLPLAALLMAIITVYILQAMVNPHWQTLSLFALICIFTAWAIQSNIDKKLYNQINKDTLREAVTAVATDLGGKVQSDDYTVVMTHNEFEHYLKRAYINYDDNWEYHKYALAVKIGEVNKYLQQHPEIKVFYYLCLKQPNTDGAVFALKQQYKLLSTVTIPFAAGETSVYKFSAKEAPDVVQIKNAGSNSINEAAKFFAEQIKRKDSRNYTTIMTHDWMEPYLRLNGIQVDTNWPSRFYDLDVHITGVTDYLNAHPSIDTLYYFALHDAKIDIPTLMLESQYQLVSKKTTAISIGQIDIFKFNTRTRPVITPELTQRAKNSPISLAAGWIGNEVKTAKPGSYVALISHYFFQPYLRLQNVTIAEPWDSHFYTLDIQAEQVLNHVAAHPAITDLYYMALRNADNERAIALLQTQYQLLAQNTTETTIGKIDTFRFNTKQTPVDKAPFMVKLSGSPVNDSSAWLAKNAAKTAGNKYTTLMTHSWFQPFLTLYGANVDKSWNGRFFDQASQLAAVQIYLHTHPDITTVYLAALLEPNNQDAINGFRKQARLSCQKLINAAHLGTIAIMKFSVRETPAGSNTAIPACPE
jgi:4-amino-4-deoxy-L-arabinose transferase-like glycosyltransferase